MADSPHLRVFAAGRTSTGRVRPNNEDNLWLGRVADPDARSGDREASGTTPSPGFPLGVAARIGPGASSRRGRARPPGPRRDGIGVRVVARVRIRHRIGG